MIDEYPVCLQCGVDITKGRSDRKFCSDGCKNLFHNKLKIQEHHEIKKVDTILKRNRRILKKIFNPRKEEVFVNKEVLLKQGFDFNFHTHTHITKKYKNEFTFCYDYGYLEIAKDRYRLIKSF